MKLAFLLLAILASCGGGQQASPQPTQPTHGVTPSMVPLSPAPTASNTPSPTTPPTSLSSLMPPSLAPTATPGRVYTTALQKGGAWLLHGPDYTGEPTIQDGYVHYTFLLALGGARSCDVYTYLDTDFQGTMYGYATTSTISPAPDGWYGGAQPIPSTPDGIVGHAVWFEVYCDLVSYGRRDSGHYYAHL